MNSKNIDLSSWDTLYSYNIVLSGYYTKEINIYSIYEKTD
jgi:hypothetical protein